MEKEQNKILLNKSINIIRMHRRRRKRLSSTKDPKYEVALFHTSEHDYIRIV